MGFILPEYTKFPEFYPFRKQVIAAHGPSCVHCSEISPYPFIQPIDYKEGVLPWDYDVSEMQVICPTCFYAAHSRVADLFRLLKEFTLYEQMALVEIIVAVTDTETPNRQLLAEHLLSQTEKEVEMPLTWKDIYDVEATKRELRYSMLALDTATIEPLADVLDLLGTASSFKRGYVLTKLFTMIDESPK